MSDPVTIAAVLELAAQTHLRAARLGPGDGWLGGWRERQFTKAMQTFISGLTSLPQSEVDRMTPEDVRQLGERIDGVVQDTERFMSRHHTSSLKRVERDRTLVRDIYELRRLFETISRGVTAGLTDLRWEMKVDGDAG